MVLVGDRVREEVVPRPLRILKDNIRILVFGLHERENIWKVSRKQMARIW